MARVPILVYHHVYPDDVMANTSPGAGVIGATDFRNHLTYLRDHNWTVVNTSDVVDWLIDGKPLPARAAVLHFDNGWLDTFTVTQPICEQFGVTATCFPITDGLEAASHGRTAAVRTLTEGVVSKPFMTWDEAGKLLDAGWELGGHTATHCKVADKHAASGDEGVLHEAHTSNALFERRLGMTPIHFAYPSGSGNDRTDALLAPIYRSLRLWHWDWPIVWSYTDETTSRLAVDCQNIDVRVPMDDFERIFSEATD